MDTSITIISSLLIAFFAFASSIKILGWQKFIFQAQLEFFISYGLNREIMFLVGLIELIGASTLWFQNHPMGLLGALLIFLTSVGAIGFHLRFDTWKDAIPAIMTGILSGFLISAHPMVASF